nr:hypothetical protein Iba_chr04eCG11370 [Ipomoea batatas]
MNKLVHCHGALAEDIWHQLHLRAHPSLYGMLLKEWAHRFGVA